VKKLLRGSKSVELFNQGEKSSSESEDEFRIRDVKGMSFDQVAKL
jgi:hypothetical protein